MRGSIRKQLFTLFGPILFGLCLVSSALSFWLVSTFSGESFDRDLINSSDSIVGRLRVKEGKVVLDLPPAALAILKHEDSDKFYFGVLGSDGRRISGDANLPPSSAGLQLDVPNFLTTRISGKEVRLVEVKVPVEDAPGQTVIVQAAETTNVRSRFQQKMLLSIAVPQLLVIVLGLFAVWYGVVRILTPLKLLQQQVAMRSQSDLSALSVEGTPEEVYPLVKALNHLLERLREELKAHQRFIANAAHQLRTPLAGLKTYSSIGCDMSDANELKHIVHKLDQGIDRASRIISQLLALARTDGGDQAATKVRTYCDLNFLVADVMAELLEQAIRKNVELAFEPSPGPASIDGEQAGLRHLVVNLIENALAYTDSGGSVIVRLRNDEHVVLSVCDSGSGIPLEEREKVFERFYRIAGTSGNGSGLGLSIVKEVINGHNASVSIESGLGGCGTVVVVEFPRE